MAIRKLGAATGTVTGIDGPGLAPVTAAGDDDAAWGEGEDAGLAAENDQADA